MPGIEIGGTMEETLLPLKLRLAVREFWKLNPAVALHADTALQELRIASWPEYSAAMGHLSGTNEWAKC